MTIEDMYKRLSTLRQDRREQRVVVGSPYCTQKDKDRLYRIQRQIEGIKVDIKIAEHRAAKPPKSLPHETIGSGENL